VQAPTATPAEPAAKKPEPFAFADFTWLTGKPAHEGGAARLEGVHR